MENESFQKIALVTGGGSGIGYAIAEKFVRNNIHTVILGRDKKKLAEAEQRLGEYCQSLAFDLDNLPGIPAMVDEIVSRYGKIDILVNNAGINLKKDFAEVTDEEFQKIIKTNVTDVFVLSREVVRKMLPFKNGCIINISSMASQYGLPKVIAYTASKSAIEGMTRSMAVDLSPLGIRVNCIAPGFIATDMSSRALNNDHERKRKVLSRTPMSRLGDPGEIADAVYFLASDEAKYITGVILPVDGGNSIGF